MAVTEHGDGVGSASTSYSGGTGFVPRLLSIMTTRMVFCRRLRSLQANAETVPHIRPMSVPSARLHLPLDGEEWLAKLPGRFTPGNETSDKQWLGG
jgi:hypothetical protein